MKVIDSFSKQYYFLSNMYPCKVEYNGIVFDCAEAAFQAQKRPSMAFAFTGIDGYTAHKRGRNLLMTVDELNEWNSRKVRTMHEIIWAKFHQNPELMEKLNETGTAILIEGNRWNDKFWGMSGLNKRDGRNMLGYLLALTRKAFVSSRITDNDGTQHVTKKEYPSGLHALREIEALDRLGIEAYTVINGHAYKNETLKANE